MKQEPKEVTGEDIRRVMSHLGKKTSERKKKAARGNWAKAREAKAKKREAGK
jgi:uncharacterized protein YneF (UPF0154 family)